MKDDSLSLTKPLLPDEQVHRLERNVKGIELKFNHPIDGSSSSFKTFFNGLNALAGVGLLSTPYALSSGGWLSLILLLIIATVSFYSTLLLEQCMKFDSNIKSYPDIGKKAFGKKGEIIVSLIIYLELYIASTGFLIMEGDNLYNLFPNAGLELAGFTIGGKQCFVILVALVILPSVWMDNLSILSYVSASGILASAIILGSVVWTAAYEGIELQRYEAINRNGIPTALSLYCFCYGAHSVFPTLYTTMRNKHQFSYVMLLCFILSTLGYASMGVVGYLMYGSNVQSQITLNLPTQNLVSKVAIFTALISPLTKFALFVSPVVNAMKELFPNQHSPTTSSISIGTALLISSVIVALVIPFFGYLMSLVGALLSVTASIILPCLCYLRISKSYQIFGTKLVVIGSILVMGVSILVLGTYTSLMQIIGTFVNAK